jgi:NAD(P)-dependent dehydrogenase (short-subunit alcohol dehydrogenase family)
VARAAAQALVDAGGTVVNIASVAGLGNVPLLGAYSGANAAVLRFTESLALEFRPSGVRVNAVCSAFVDTPTIDRVAGPLREVAKAAGMTFEQLIEMKQMRLGRPEEVAEMVAFLASEDSSWTTGSAFALDGGMTGSLV